MTKIDRQKKLLKGFEKVVVEPGESKTVTIPISMNDLRYYDMDTKGWVLEPGQYVFYVGPCSDEEALLAQTIELL